MGKVAYCLHHSLIALALQLVEQQRQQDRRGESEKYVQAADGQRVAHDDGKIPAGQELTEVFKAHPFRREKRTARNIVFERDDQPVHRVIQREQT